VISCGWIGIADESFAELGYLVDWIGFGELGGNGRRVDDLCSVQLFGTCLSVVGSAR